MTHANLYQYLRTAMRLISNIEEFAGIAATVRGIHQEADRQFYDGRIFKKVRQWQDYVNTKAKALPAKLEIVAAPAELLREYQRQINEYRRTHSFLRHVASAVFSIATLKPVEAASAFTKIGQYLQGLDKTKLSTELYSLCSALEQQYTISGSLKDQGTPIRGTRGKYFMRATAYGSVPDGEHGIFLR